MGKMGGRDERGELLGPLGFRFRFWFPPACGGEEVEDGCGEAVFVDGGGGLWGGSVASAEEEFDGKVVLLRGCGAVCGGKVRDCGEGVEFTDRGARVVDVEVREGRGAGAAVQAVAWEEDAEAVGAGLC